MTDRTLEVEGVVLREIRLPLREPLRISSGLCTELRILLLARHQEGTAAPSAW